MANINQSIIGNLCNLAKLSLNKEEKKNLTSDLKKILEYMESINEINTESTKPLIYLTSNKRNLRPDSADNNYQRNEILKNCPEKNSSYIKVPRVIDK